jgi:hypothetical protein
LDTEFGGTGATRSVPIPPGNKPNPKALQQP